MGGPGSGRKKGSGGSKKGMVKIKLNPKKKVDYTIEDIGPGGKVMKTKKGRI